MDAAKVAKEYAACVPLKAAVDAMAARDTALAADDFAAVMKHEENLTAALEALKALTVKVNQRI